MKKMILNGSEQIIHCQLHYSREWYKAHSNRWLRTFFLAIAFILFPFVCAFSQIYQGNKTIWGMISAKGNYALVTGAFNGSDYFITDEEIIVVPDINSAAGFGASLGVNSGKWSYDIAYYRSVHDYSSYDTNFIGTCSNNIIRFIGLKAYFKPDKWFNPFFDFDMSGHWITLKKGGIRIDNPDLIIPATYGGISFGVGGGISFQTRKNISFEIGTLASWLMGTDVKVKKGLDYEIKGFSNFLLNSSVGMTYHFR